MITMDSASVGLPVVIGEESGEQEEMSWRRLALECTA